MKFQILSEGRETADPSAPLVADYITRIQKFHPIEDTVARPLARNGLVPKARLLHSKGWMLVALDERGKEFTSEAFSVKLVEWMTMAPAGILFVIGGAEGLPEEIRKLATHTIALSRMTFPHRLARLLLAEQIYRALCIHKNIPYHK